MNIFHLLAAIVAFGSMLLHVIAGGAEIHVPIQDSDLSLPLKAISGVLWHGVTMMLAAGGIVALLLARKPNKPAAIGAALFSFGYVPVFLYYSISQLGGPFGLPQWVLFTAYSALMLGGVMRRPYPSVF